MDERMLITYVVVDIFCIVLALSMWRYIGNDFGREFEVKTLRNALSSYCSFLLFGLLGILMENGYFPFVRGIVWISNIISLLSLILVSYFWFLFTMSRLNSRIFPMRKWVYIAQIPLLAASVICLSSPLTGWAFTITADGTYQRGPYFLLLCLLIYLYAFLVVIQSFISGNHEKQREKKFQCWLIGIFMFFPIGTGILQIYLSGTPILAPAIITVSFLVFTNVQSTQVFSDSLTGLNNRRRVFQYLEERIPFTNDYRPLVIYMLDINSFKQINDQYGHIEGDRAIKVVAAVLMKFCQKRHVFAARYGGDEFLVASTQRHSEKPESLMGSFHALLEQKCKANHIAYPLSVCIGYAVVTDPKERVEHAISRADQCLYEEKRRYHGSEKQ